MYDLNLSADQLEIRETVRRFATQEIKPVVLHPDRLQRPDRVLPLEILDQASQMGLRTLALSEALGGAGADNLTCCLAMEELAAGDVDIAATLGHTSMLGHILFDQLLTPGQRARFLPQFLADDRYHLASAAYSPESELGWKYHRSYQDKTVCGVSAVRRDGEWVVNGMTSFVANAPVAKLFAVDVRTDPGAAGKNGVSALLIPRDTKGLTVQEPQQSGGGSHSQGEPFVRWFHGTGGQLVFKDCRVAAENLLGKEGASPLDGVVMGRGTPQVQAMNVGIGRAAYEAAVEYAKLRVQGARRIIEHQAIGSKLAEAAIKLEVARSMVWRAAWAADHPDAYASLSELPLQTIAKVFTSQVVYEVTEDAAECFGGMGVMLDMPLPKYIHDARIFLHSGDSNSVAKLRIAEALAGFQRT